MTDTKIIEKLVNCRCGSHKLDVVYIYSRGMYNIYCTSCENELFVKGTQEEAIMKWREFNDKRRSGGTCRKD